GSGFLSPLPAARSQSPDFEAGRRVPSFVRPRLWAPGNRVSASQALIFSLIEDAFCSTEVWWLSLDIVVCCCCCCCCCCLCFSVECRNAPLHLGTKSVRK